MSLSMSGTFGTTTGGEAVHRISLVNESLEVDVLTWGAAIQSLRLRGCSGSPADVVLGFASLADYEADTKFVGAVAGRYANRIADGRFALDGIEHRLPRNDRGHTLHGGPDGFHRQVWSATPVGTSSSPGVLLEHISPDGAMGFPGTLRATCRYLLDGHDLAIELRAVTDRPTVVNLTQHTYFNLAGGPGTAEGHEVWIDAARYLPTDASGRPHPSPEPVAGTPFDFRRPKLLGADLRRPHQQLVGAAGYDHWLLLNDPHPARASARLRDPASGRTVEILTDQAGLQLYSGNFLDGTAIGKQGTLRQGDGVCLETQRSPDGPNRPDAAAVTLRPGEEYVARTTWRFSVQP